MQNLNDSLALKSRLGCPDYFLTMTCNPNWDEITSNLRRDNQGNLLEKPKDRGDLIVRAFDMRMDALIEELKNGVIGGYVAMVCVQEYQKRGLPHLHLLLWVETEHKPVNAEILDQVINACLPDPETQPDLFKFVSQYCMHARCDVLPNAKCKTNNKCRSHFPKPFLEYSEASSTQTYSRYKRLNNRRYVTISDAEKKKALKIRYI